MSKLDLAAFTADLANEPFVVTIKHPITLEDTDTKVMVVGFDSDAATAVLDMQQSKRLKLLSRGKEVPMTPEVARANATELLVACTIGWENMEYNGQLLEFNQDNVTMIYSKVPFLRDQINAAAGDRANFFKS